LCIHDGLTGGVGDWGGRRWRACAYTVEWVIGVVGVGVLCVSHTRAHNVAFFLFFSFSLHKGD
jgi:hypothetical protein